MDQVESVDQAGRVVSADPVGQVVLADPVDRAGQEDAMGLACSAWQSWPVPRPL